MAELNGPEEGTMEKSPKPLELNHTPETVQDAVFGEITKEGSNYRNMRRIFLNLISKILMNQVGWLDTVALMMKTQFGLGVLSIPEIFDTLGLISGVICLCVIASISTWSNYVIGTFKLRHPEVYGIDDAGGLMFSPIGCEAFGVGVYIYWIFCTGSRMLSTSIGLNTISSHGTCTAVSVAVSAIVSFSLASIRTLGKIKWTAWVSVGSVFTAVMIITVAIGLQSRPSTAPQTGPWVSNYRLFGNPLFTKAISSVSSLVYAYSGTPGFFPIAAEMHDPSLYTRSVLVCQPAVTAIYIAVGCVIYYYLSC